VIRGGRSPLAAVHPLRDRRRTQIFVDSDQRRKQIMDSASPGKTAPRVLASLLTGAREPADLYSVEGSQLYEELAAFDDSEQRELLQCLLRTRGDILELACGGGRLTLPLLALGRPVVGIDRSAEMIRMLRARHDRLPASRRRVALTTKLADMRGFALDRRFGAIVLAATSITLLDRHGRREMYGAVKKHLAPDGRFFVTVHASPLRAGATSTRLVVLPGARPAVVLLSEVVDTDAHTREVTALRVLGGDDGAPDAGAFGSTVFLIAEAELDAELAGVGLVRTGSIGVEGSETSGALRIAEYAAC
jgi:SAM-dependent methyltransferase